MADYTGRVTAYNGHPLYEGRPSGSFADPAGTAADIVFNAGYDFIDLAGGLKTSADLATARFFEGVPTPQNHGMIKPWVRPEDLGTLGQMGGAIIGNYQHAYVDPIVQGRPLDIGKHFIAHPLNTLTDINAAAQLTGLPKAASKAIAARAQAKQAVTPVAGQPITAPPPPSPMLSEAEKAIAAQAAAEHAVAQQAAEEAQAKAAAAAQQAAMMKQAAAQKQAGVADAQVQQAMQAHAAAEQAAIDAAKHAQDMLDAAAKAAFGAPGKDTPLGAAIEEANAIKDRLIGKVTQFADDVGISSPEKRAGAELAGDFKTAVLSEEIQMTDDLGRYWNKIADKDAVQAYAEGWHPDLIAGKKPPKEIADYLAKAEEYSEKMRNRISKFVPEVDLALDKYQPAAIKLNGFTTKQWQEMSRKTQLDILNFTKKQMDAKGIKPQYSPHVMAGEANRVLRNPTTMQKDFTTDPAKAHFLKTKQSDGSKAIKSHYESMRVRWLQISQFQQAYEKILESAIDVAQRIKVLEEAPSLAAQQIAAEVKAALEAEQSLQKAALDKALQAQAEAQKELAEAVQKYNEAAAKAATDAAAAAKAKAQALSKELAARKAEAKAMQDLADKAQKALDEHLAQPTKTTAEQMADKGYASISGQKLIETVLGPLQGSVISEADLAKLAAGVMPGDIYLPKEMIGAINAAMKSNRPASNGIAKWYDKYNTFSKRYQLGGNPTYGLAQTGQAIFMLEMVAMNGVRSAVTSILSYWLAFNKTIRQTVPLSIADDVLASTITSQRYLDDAIEALFNQPIVNKSPNFFQAPLKKIASAYETFVDFNLKVGAVGDSFVRAKAAIQHALLIAQENTPLGQAVREMFDTTKTVHMLNTTFMDDVAKMNVAKQVNNALGNFREISEQAGMKALGRLTPYPAWLAFITQYTLKLPVNHPYKTLLLNNIAQLQDRYVADKNVPSYLKGAVRIAGVGPNGMPQVVVKEGMNPLTSVPQLLEAVQTAMTGQGDDSLVSLTPAPFQLTFMLLTRLNPMTLDDFTDPTLAKAGNNFYTKDDALKGNIAKGIAKPVRPMPDPITLTLRSSFPVQERWAESIMEKAYSNGQRSQMSSLFKSAPKLNRATGGLKKAPDWITLFIQNLVNVTPIEYDPNAVFLEEQTRNREQSQALKSIMRRDAALGR